MTSPTWSNSSVNAKDEVVWKTSCNAHHCESLMVVKPVTVHTPFRCSTAVLLGGLRQARPFTIILWRVYYWFTEYFSFFQCIQRQLPIVMNLLMHATLTRNTIHTLEMCTLWNGWKTLIRHVAPFTCKAILHCPWQLCNLLIRY